MTDETTQAVEPAIAATNATNATPQGAADEVAQHAASAAAATDASATDAKPKGVARRIDELTRNWREAERREAALLEMLRKQQSGEQQPQASPPAKTLADFDFDEGKYQSYLFGEATRRATEAAKRELAEQAQRDTETRRQRSFTERETKFAITADDYFEVTRNPSLPISAAMAEAIAESDDGPSLAYYLGKNPDIAEKLAGMAPMAAARELGRIEARLASEHEQPPVAVSKAPPPPPTIAATEPAIDRDPSKMTDAEFRKWRLKQIAQRR